MIEADRWEKVTNKQINNSNRKLEIRQWKSAR